MYRKVFRFSPECHTHIIRTFVYSLLPLLLFLACCFWCCYFCAPFIFSFCTLLLFLERCFRCRVVGYTRRREIQLLCSVSLFFFLVVSSVKCNRADESWRYGKEFWLLFRTRCKLPMLKQNKHIHTLKMKEELRFNADDGDVNVDVEDEI